jgi:DedD protein
MEKKTTQRIIGVLVAIALIIVVLPLLASKNEEMTQNTSIKAPPFPDQASSNSASSKTVTSSPVITPAMAEKINTAANQPNPQLPQQVTIKNEPTPPAPVRAAPSMSSTVVAQSNVTAPAPVSSSEVIPAPSKPEPTELVKSGVIPVVANNSESNHKDNFVPKNIHTSKQVSKKIKTSSLQHHSVIQAHNKAAWVIQLGSFKEKNNARRLADKLRAAGYKAFMHEVNKGDNAQTRVYIGPEYQEASAEKLSMKIQQQLKLHGFVVPYKPFKL